MKTENQQQSSKSGLNPEPDKKLEAKIAKQGKDLDPLLSPEQKEGYVPGLVGTCLCIGQTGSGKTVTLNHMINSDKIWKGKFRRIHLFAVTASVDPSFKHMKKEQLAAGVNFQIHDDVSQWDDILEDIIDEQEELVKSGANISKHLVLVIMEDATMHDKWMKRSKELSRLATTSRHYGIFAWISVHKVRLVPRLLRMNAWYIFFFYGLPATERDQFVEENLVQGISKKDFTTLIEHCVKEKHSFAFINKKLPINEQLHCKFEERIDVHQ